MSIDEQELMEALLRLPSPEFERVIELCQQEALRKLRAARTEEETNGPTDSSES